MERVFTVSFQSSLCIGRLLQSCPTLISFRLNKPSSLGFSVKNMFSKYLSSFGLVPPSLIFHAVWAQYRVQPCIGEPVFPSLAYSLLNNRSQEVICVLCVIVFCSSVWSPNVLLPLHVFDLSFLKIALPLIVEMF